MKFFYKSDLILINSDPKLRKLLNEKDGCLTETKLKETLEQYNLKDILCLLSIQSKKIYKSNTENLKGFAQFISATGSFVTQTALMYMANIAITSGSNDYKWSLLALDVYSNACILSMIYHNKMRTNRELSALQIILQMYYTQIKHQMPIQNTIARNYILFEEIANQIPFPSNNKTIGEYFKEKIGVNIKEYLQITFIIFGIILDKEKNCFISIEELIPVDFSSDILTREKVEKVFKLLSANYTKFIQVDTSMNENKPEELTQTRFNTLSLFPIIELEDKRNGNYIIPNIIAFANKAFVNIFWTIHNLFEEDNLHLRFREFFGKELFEKYVGDLLKEIYVEETIYPEITYKKSGSESKFVDWIVETNDKIYLFEIKGYQYSIKAQQTGEIEKEIEEKIIRSIKKLYTNVKDIDAIEDLAFLRNKRVIPIIVYYDIPMIHHAIYQKVIDKGLKNLIDNSGYDSDILKFKYYQMNIEDLEYFLYVSNNVQLESLHEELKLKPQENILSLIKNYYEKKEDHANTRLNKTFDRIFNQDDIYIPPS